jgi:hypothetical protein
MRLRKLFSRSFLVLACLCVSCAHERRASQVYRGTYLASFEHSDFIPEGSRDERWWLAGDIGKISSWITDHRYYGSPVLVMVQGSLSKKGGFGHLLSYERELRVTRVLDVRPRQTEEK